MNDSRVPVRHPWALLVLLALAMRVNFFLRVNLAIWAAATIGIGITTSFAVMLCLLLMLGLGESLAYQGNPLSAVACTR